MTWTPADIGDLTGKTAVITGVTGGLGWSAARTLAKHGARVIGTARNADSGRKVVADITHQVPGSQIEILDLDLASLNSTITSAHRLISQVDSIDILLNNAGIMAPPFSQTEDGYELQLGTNHLGHFAWTATLWPLLNESGSRIVSVSSLAHSMAKTIDLDVLTPEGSQKPYNRVAAYAQSKLANLLFMKELDRRIKATGSTATSVAAHPGVSSTNLTKTGPGSGGSAIIGVFVHQIGKLISQSAEAGSWPLLLAATDQQLTGGEYAGPSKLRQTRGTPRLVGMTAAARDPELAAQLWAASELASGVQFELP